MFEVKYDKDGKVISPPPENESAEEVTHEQVQQEDSSSVEEAPEEQQLQEEARQDQAPPVGDNSKEINFTKLRDKTERLEKERDEALRLMKEMQSRFPDQDKQKGNTSIDEEEDQFSIDPDDIVEGKHLSQVQKQLKQMREQLKAYEQQAQALSVEQRIKNQYPDFDKVVTADHLEELKSSDPEFAESLHYNPNLYSKAVAAYKAIKRFGIYQEDTFTDQKVLAKKNAAKPRPLTSVNPQQGDSPLSKANAFANGLTEELKEQLRREMEEARKNY